MAKLPITPSKGLTPILKFGYGILDDLGFFSRAEKVIDLLPPKAQVGKGSDIITKIEEIGGKPVKDELLFTGLKDEFIEAPRVTSQELTDYLNQNKTMIQEKVRSKKKDAEQKAKQGNEQDGFNEYLQDQIYYGRPDEGGPAGGYNQGVPDWVNMEGFDVDGGDVSFTQGLTQINALPLNSLKSTTRTLFSTRNNDLNLEVRGNLVVEEGEQNRFLQDFLLSAEQSQVPFIEIKKSGTDITTIGNNSIGWLTYLKSNLPDNLRGENNVSVSSSLNEAQLQANRLLVDVEQPDLKDKIYGEPDIDLTPKHEQYTVTGGDNYQEIILTAKETPDKYIEKVGNVSPDLLNALQTNRLLTSIDKQHMDLANQTVVIGHSNPEEEKIYRNRLKRLNISDDNITELDKTFVNTPSLNKDSLLELLVQGKLKKFGENFEVTDTGGIFKVKPEFAVDVHFPEKNIVVYARTKDRVDEDGGKNLATEELQSDLSQKGRGKGMALGLREQKQFINKRSPVLHGDVLDAYQELETVSNIGDLRFNSMLFNIDRNQDGGVTRDFDADKFFDGTQQYVDADFNKYTIPEMLNASNTKYKFHDTKDAKTKMLTYMGFSKGDDALTVDEFYNKKIPFLPYGRRTNEQIENLKEVYQSRNQDIFNIFQENKNKLYSKVDDFASFSEIAQLKKIIKAERALLSNKIARDEIVFKYPRPDGETNSFMVQVKDSMLADDGFATTDSDRYDFGKVANTKYIYENELTPEEKLKYEGVARDYFDVNEDNFTQMFAVVLKPDDPNPTFTFEEFKATPDFYRKKIFENYLNNNELPKKTQDRIEGYISQVNNFIKKDNHFGMGANAGRIRAGLNNFDDYINKQTELGDSTPAYMGGNQQYNELKSKYNYGMDKINKILAENNNEIGRIRRSKVGPVNYDFKLDYGNADRADVFKKLQNFDEATEKLENYKRRIEQNSEKEIPSLPFLGDSKKFAEIGIKRLILKGIEEGYDTVSILPAHVHVERWQEPNLRQFYDVTIPSVVKDILKGTGQKAEIKKIFPSKMALKRYEMIKNIDEVVDELVATKYKQPEINDADRTEYIAQNITDGFKLDMFPMGRDEQIKFYDKSKFLKEALSGDNLYQNVPPRIAKDISELYNKKFPDDSLFSQATIRNRLRYIHGLHHEGLKNADELFDGTKEKIGFRKNARFGDPDDIDTLYNEEVAKLYVDERRNSGENAYLPSITIKLTPELKEYAQSGISLYTSLPVAVGTGAITAQQILGTEEDIIEQEEDVL